jgi:hypothetical protein
MVFALVLLRMMDLLVLLVRLRIVGQFRMLGLSMFGVLRIVLIVIVVSMLRALVMILRLAIIWTPAIRPVAWESWARPYFGNPLDLVTLLFMMFRCVRSNKLQTCNASTENEADKHFRNEVNWFCTREMKRKRVLLLFELKGAKCRLYITKKYEY